MNTPPKSDGEKSDRDIDESDDSEDGGKISPLVFAHNASKHEIGDINKPEDQGCCQPRVPRPPNIPDGSRPYGTGYQDNAAKDHTDLHRAIGDDVPFGIFFVEIQDTGQKRDEKGKKRQKGGREVNIKNFLDNPHGLFNGSMEKDGVEGGNHHQKGQDLIDCHKDFLDDQFYSSMINSKVR